MECLKRVRRQIRLLIYIRHRIERVSELLQKGDKRWISIGLL